MPLIDLTNLIAHLDYASTSYPSQSTEIQTEKNKNLAQFDSWEIFVLRKW